MLKKTLIATMLGAALVSTSVVAQQMSPSDGRSGGTGIPSAVSGATPSTSADRYAVREWWYAPHNMTYSLTDGRSGGTGVPSAVSGAVPSTAPSEDLSRLTTGNHASVTNRYELPRLSLFDSNRYAQ
jgi:hypothetical protein